MFENVYLELEQKELLSCLVEAWRNTSKENRQPFMLLAGEDVLYLIHPGLPGESQVYMGDVKTLAERGFLRLEYSSRVTPSFDITPQGFQYYAYIKEKSGNPVHTMESFILDYLKTDKFQSEYLIAYKKWAEAAKKLWDSESQDHFTLIGHLCREAVQEFVDRLIKLNEFDNKIPKSNTVARMKLVLENAKGKLGKTEEPFLQALLAYWGTTLDLIQRQEHGSEREGKTLIWEDARRVVFQTALVMFEFDRAIFR